MSTSDEYPEVGPGTAAYRLARAELASRREPHPQPAADPTGASGADAEEAK